MPQKINFVLKVLDANMVKVKKALEQADIKVESIVQVHKETLSEPAKPDKKEVAT